MAVEWWDVFINRALVESAALRGHAVERAGRVDSDGAVGRVGVAGIAEGIQNFFGVGEAVLGGELVDGAAVPGATANRGAVKSSGGGEGERGECREMAVVSFFKGVDGPSVQAPPETVGAVSLKTPPQLQLGSPPE